MYVFGYRCVSPYPKYYLIKYRQYIMARCSEVVTDFDEAWHGLFTITGHPTLYLSIFIQ